VYFKVMTGFSRSRGGEVRDLWQRSVGRGQYGCHRQYGRYAERDAGRRRVTVGGKDE